jgi:hypothetical protein
MTSKTMSQNQRQILSVANCTNANMLADLPKCYLIKTLIQKGKHKFCAFEREAIVHRVLLGVIYSLSTSLLTQKRNVKWLTKGKNKGLQSCRIRHCQGCKKIAARQKSNKGDR